MASWPHLQRRGTTYYFRRRVPAHLQSAFAKKEWIISLGTGSPDQARRLCRAKSYEIDEMIARADMFPEAPPATVSKVLVREDIEPLANTFVAKQLALDLIARQTLRTAYAKKMAATVEEELTERGDDLARGRLHVVSSLSDELLTNAGFLPPTDSELQTSLSWSLLAARREVAEALHARSKGRYVPTPANAPQRPSRGSSDRSVGDLVLAYTKLKASTHGDAWVSKRYGHLFRALTELLGSQTPLSAVDREGCRKVRSLLERTPAHASKRYVGKSLKDAADLAAVENAPLISATTVNSYLSGLSAMLAFAVSEGWIKNNPAAGLIGKAVPSVRRRGFSEAELTKVFESLRSASFQSWQFWLPALALYTGARANELCQLQVGDFVEHDGEFWLKISIYDSSGRIVDWKQLKTPSSERKVPIYSALVDAGLKSFLEKNPKTEDRLFPDMIGTKGNYSRVLSRWFAKYLESVDLSEPSLVFHSFRHTFKTACLKGGIADSTIRALGGWAKADIAEGYGDRSPDTVMRRAIEQIDLGRFQLPKQPRTGN